MIKKFTILILLLLFLTGCVSNFGNKKNTIINKEFILAGEKVKVGNTLLGAETAKFKPEIKLEKWGDETSIRVWSEEEGDDKAIEKDGKIIWKTKDNKKEYNFYPVKLENNVDGFEYEIILNEKPDNNIINLKIDLNGVECYYQPELTQEEKDNGNIRPENIIGSYACYHESKSGDYSKMGGKNYMAGKAFHIYRPQMEDANGNKEWGKLKIEGNNLSVEIPQEFLDNAVYPIKYASGLTFGYISEGASNFGTQANYAEVTKGIPSDGNGVVNKISVYARYQTENKSTKGVIWLVTDGTIISNGVGDTVIISSASNAWHDMTYSTQPNITNGTAYYVGLVSESNPVIMYDAGSSGDGGEDNSNNYAIPETLTNPLAYTTTKFSIYATYTTTEEERRILSPIFFE